MVERQERELVLGSVKAYLEELLESGIDELEFAELPAGRSGEPRSPLQAETVAPKAASAERPEGAAPQAKGSAPQAKGSADGRPVPEPAWQGVGNPEARMVLVMKGEGFAGAAGELLGKIVQAMGFATSDVFLLSFSDVAPTRESLLRQIRDVGPELVVALGQETAQLLLQSGAGIAELRGKFHDLDGVPLMPTLHPEAMLEDPALKRQVWSEMQQVMRRLAQPTLSH